MCSITCLKFGKRNLSEIDVKDKEVIEVGAYNVNGSIRDYKTYCVCSPRGLGMEISMK